MLKFESFELLRYFILLIFEDVLGIAFHFNDGQIFATSRLGL